MNKNTFTAVRLAKGEVNVYDFGKVKLHAYKTNDFIDDEVFIVEKGGNAVVIESPCFFDNNAELEQYIAGRGMCVQGVLLAYHMAGAGFLPNAKKFATKNAEAYGHSGGGKGLIENFTAAFGEAFDNGIHTVTDYLAEGKVTIGGMDFIMDSRLVYCLQHGLPLDMDVYDLAEWCCLAELGELSMDNNCAPVAFPDFTRGEWNVVKGYKHAYAAPEEEAAAMEKAKAFTAKLKEQGAKEWAQAEKK